MAVIKTNLNEARFDFLFWLCVLCFQRQSTYILFQLVCDSLQISERIYDNSSDHGVNNNVTYVLRHLGPTSWYNLTIGASNSHGDVNYVFSNFVDFWTRGKYLTSLCCYLGDKWRTNLRRNNKNCSRRQLCNTTFLRGLDIFDIVIAISTKGDTFCEFLFLPSTKKFLWKGVIKEQRHCVSWGQTLSFKVESHHPPPPAFRREQQQFWPNVPCISSP